VQLAIWNKFQQISESNNIEKRNNELEDGERERIRYVMFLKQHLNNLGGMIRGKKNCEKSNTVLFHVRIHCIMSA